jgi:limonene-1,2-epoxide hydrolase
MSGLIEVLNKLQAANVRRDKAAILALVTADVEYHFHVGTPPLIGFEGISKFLDRYWGMASELVWRIDHHAENGDKLLVEGYEEFVNTKTGQKVAHPYMGIFEIRDGKIAKWRDYFEKDPPAPAAAAAPAAR